MQSRYNSVSKGELAPLELNPPNLQFRHVNGVIELNVGGRNFTTQYQTLLSVPSRFFSNMISLDQRSGRVIINKDYITEDRAGKIFINRDGDLFKYILQYMRDGKRCVLPTDAVTLRQLHREAEFYGIDPLQNLISERLLDEHRTISRKEAVMDDLIEQVHQVAVALRKSAGIPEPRRYQDENIARTPPVYNVDRARHLREDSTSRIF
uniref:BTB domain-containing protein n=1 Tax=Steinernema glaseri TaxID=37863 RepID=A0A1I7ZNI8_9BILA